MIKTVILSDINGVALSNKINEWIEKKKEENTPFIVKNIQYQPVATSSIISDRAMIVYEERTEKEADKLLNVFADALFGGKTDEGAK